MRIFKCVTAEQAQYIIKEFHEGICDYHSGARTTSTRILRAGYFLLSPWPFAKWGMDILDPFSPGKGQVKFLIVAVDYYTKWIEAKPLTTITAQQV